MASDGHDWNRAIQRMTDPQQGDALEAAAREIAELAGMSGARVYAILRRHGLRAPAPDPDREALVERIWMLAGWFDKAATDSPVSPCGAIADDLREAARALAAPAERGGWRPIESAKKDGSDTLVLMRCDGIPEHADWMRGRCFVVRHPGIKPDGRDFGWNFPGIGGIPDRWIYGWAPLPPAPERQDGP